MDDIAHTAGVSKATLCKYFHDKYMFFTEVATSECQRQAGAALTTIDFSVPPHEGLGQTGTHFSAFNISRFSACAVQDPDGVPEPDRSFYDYDPVATRAEMAIYFAKACVCDELVIDDYIMVAEQFRDLCKGGLSMRPMFGVIKETSVAEINGAVGSAVKTFLARYET